jgi:hypothetical protein
MEACYSELVLVVATLKGQFTQAIEIDFRRNKTKT